MAKSGNSPCDELAAILSPKAVAAFRKLCDLGCGHDYLDFQLLFIGTDEVTIPLRDLDRDTGRVVEVPGKARTIALHSLDDWKKAVGGLNLDDLRQIAARAKQLQKDIRKLRKTELVRSLVLDGTLRRGDLLAGSLLRETPAGLNGLIALPTIIKKRFSRRTADRDQLRVALAKHIREKTGDWQDRLRAEILVELPISNPGHPITTKSESQWRKRQRLTY